MVINKCQNSQLMSLSIVCDNRVNKQFSHITCHIPELWFYYCLFSTSCYLTILDFVLLGQHCPPDIHNSTIMSLNKLFRINTAVLIHINLQ